MEAIFLEGGGNRSCLQIARDNAVDSSLSLSLSSIKFDFEFKLEESP